MTGATKSVLVVSRHGPYGSGLARSAVDHVLASAAFDQPVTLLFLGEGVLQLLPEQDGASVGSKTIAKQLSALPLYDVERVYADSTAASRFGIDLAVAPTPVQPVNAEQVRELLAEHDHVLGF